MMDIANALIVDTNVELYEYSSGIWDSYGIKSHRIDTIEQALEILSVYRYHLIVIVECKKQRPFVLESIKLFRELTFAPIVIASTDPVDPEYSIAGFNLGADEVWEMPERIEVAVAKGHAIIRRYIQLNKEIDKQSTLIANNHIILSTEQRIVYVKWQKVILKKRDFDILALLITHAGTVLSHERIYYEVWGREYTLGERETIRNHICNLRAKLNVDSSMPKLIQTHHGIGYSYTPYYDKR